MLAQYASIKVVIIQLQLVLWTVSIGHAEVRKGSVISKMYPTLQTAL